MQTLIPRFTLRNLLLITAGCGVVFAILSIAVRSFFQQEELVTPDQRFASPGVAALAVVVCVVSLVGTLIAYGCFFTLAWVVAQLVSLLQPPPAPKSPFAQHQAPPQLLPPEDPAI